MINLHPLEVYNLMILTDVNFLETTATINIPENSINFKDSSSPEVYCLNNRRKRDSQ